MSVIPLSASELTLYGRRLESDSTGPLDDSVRAHLRSGRGGLVVLGTFGSGKTALCDRLAHCADTPACSVVPLRVVARATSVAEGIRRAVGAQRFAEIQAGERFLLLDGLDEVARPGDGSYPAFFDQLVEQAGRCWVLTSRPGHFRTDASEPLDDQVDTLTMAGVRTLVIDPIPLEEAHRRLAEVGGARLLESVEGLEHLVRSPILLNVVYAALPFIEPGRPIQPWGVFDAWLRYALHTGPEHPAALSHLQSLAWSAFRDNRFSAEGASFPADEVARLRLPDSLRRALFVTDLDGRLRFGHRSLYDFLVATHIAPQLAANQGRGPDDLSGTHISEAMRVFLVGQVPPMRMQITGDRVRIPAGNFVSGGLGSSDERPLRITHLPHPFWVSRAPVTNKDWQRFLAERPDDRVDIHYLAHWTGNREAPPPEQGDSPVYNLWPEDADRYADWAGARLPSADEWEKAARGLDGRRWPWGDWWVPGRAQTSEVGLAHPLSCRALGSQGPQRLYAAVGGVFEYTSTPWRGRPDRGRVVMGGCFTHPHLTSRAGLRLSHTLSGNLKAGLRLAWDG